ncbi:MAG: hypothetical protein ACRDWB_00585 [Acidimicrobiales bacterium]
MVDEDNEDPSLNDRILDVFVYAPAGFLLSALDDFPKLAALGRERLGTQVSNARVLGEFAVKAGRDQLKKRGEGLLHRGSAADAPDEGPPVGLHAVPTPPPNGAPDDPAPESTPSPVPTASSSMSSNGHVPSASSLAIPGFDTLSASQVVQRLDGLSRAELVSARAYEAGTRGRRTILSRIDQLLEERA